MQASSKLRRRNRCPPHTPLIVQSSGDGRYYVAQCLTCGLGGPERKSTSKAWRAFDELSERLE